MPLNNVYKFYGRCYYIDNLGYERETDVSISYSDTLNEALLKQSNFINKNIPQEVIIEEPSVNNSEENTSTENI